MKKNDIIGIDCGDADKLKYNLYLRSERRVASQFEWDNPEEADGVPILARQEVSGSDPNIRIAYDNFSTIGNTKSSYLASNILRTYADDIDEAVKLKYKEFDRANNLMPTLSKMMSSCGMLGDTYGLCYIDRYKTVRFKQIQAWNATIIYDEETGEPIKGFIYFNRDKKDYIKEYDSLNVITYVSEKNKNEYEIVEVNLHGFTEMPLIEFMNNDQRAGNAQKAIPLIDAYDRIMSDNVTEWSTFRNAYLMLKNVGVIDDKVKEDMKKTGIFAVDGEGAEAKFLTKDVNPEFTKFVTEETWAGIWIVACSVDPRALATLSNATIFQIKQMYKLLEEDSQNTENEWNISLEYLDRVLKSYWTGLDLAPVKDYSTYDINYIFNRNMPKDNVSDLEAIKRAGGNVPQREIFMRALGVDEKTADEMVELASSELIESLSM